ncbi:hypothetical protein WDU94_009195 [Cyamophila willieti]
MLFYLEKIQHTNLVPIGMGCFLLLVLSRYLDPFSKIRYYGNFAIFILHSSVLGALMIPYMLIFSFRKVSNCYRLGSPLILPVSKLLGIKWELRDEEYLKEQRPGVVVVNHQSMFDILGLFSVWPVMKDVAAVSKKELLFVFPFGFVAYLAGVIFISRLSKSSKSGQQTIEDAADQLFKDNGKLLIFPEGTRNKNPNKLLPFRKGAFRVAIKNQVPIYPLVYSPFYFIDMEHKRFGFGKITIKALEPIQTKGKTMEELDQVIQETHKVMSEAYNDLRQENPSKEAYFESLKTK